MSSVAEHAALLKYPVGQSVIVGMLLLELLNAIEPALSQYPPDPPLEPSDMSYCEIT